jgi:hypothetical protein
MASPEMKSALAAALKASSVASRSERCMSATTPREADGPVVLAQVGVFDSLLIAQKSRAAFHS